MKKYSKSVKVGGYKFRYNYTDCEVEWLYDGNRKGEVLDSIGLRTENWLNKEVRNEYLLQWADEIIEEVDYLVEMELQDYRMAKGA